MVRWSWCTGIAANKRNIIGGFVNILYISDVYFPRVNGVSTSIATYLAELKALGHRVHLIAPDYGQAESEAEITRIPGRQLMFDPEDRLMGYRQAMKQLDWLRQQQFDIIHVQTPFVAHYLGSKLSRLLNIPCVETYHTFFEEYLHCYLPLIPRVVTRWLARRLSCSQGNQLDGMVLPSFPMLQVLRAYGVTTHAEVIPTGLRSDRFAPGDGLAFRLDYGIAARRPMLLFLGRVAFEKNIGFLLDMLQHVKSQLPDVLLLITGEGPALNALQQQARQLQLQDNVMFLGYLDRMTELNSCYRAADIFVFSSCTETQGLVLLEAMAQATPVVSNAEMGTKEVLQQGEGAEICELEAEAFAGRVIALLRDKERRVSLGLKGQHYAHDWSAPRLAERMLEFYARTMVATEQHQQHSRLAAG